MSSAPNWLVADAVRDGELGGSPAYLAACCRAPARVDDRATPAGAFYEAQRRYLAGQRIDMQALAAHLEVSRPTLYRWTGGREQLLADVLFFFADGDFQRARAATAHLSGPARLIATFRLHVEALVNAVPLQTFLRQETQAALRVLTARDSSVQMRTIARLAGLYREEQARGTFRPRVDVDTLAYAVVKVTEAFIYNDAIAAVEPEVERATQIVTLMLENAR